MDVENNGYGFLFYLNWRRLSTVETFLLFTC